ncbi:hypothetical protein C8R44DRAFT_738828 [Mycena epipterygia]|nr:hypothetical protein C8R44DRAFT_738828 [Mycena epipterygia]
MYFGGTVGTLVQLAFDAFSKKLTSQSQIKMVIITNGLSAAVDVMISVILAILLQSSKTGFKESMVLINRLMAFTFATGLPTSSFALLAAVSIGAFPQIQLYVCFCILPGRLYTNSLLVTLNSREYIRSGTENGSGEQFLLQISGHHRIIEGSGSVFDIWFNLQCAVQINSKL